MTGRQTLGWIAVALNCVVSCSWTIWGTVENFHEGWFGKTPGAKLLWSLAYLSAAILWTILGVIAIKWPRVGALAVFSLGISLSIFILATRTHYSLAVILSWLPFMGAFGLIAVFWWFGSPEPKKWAFLLSVGLPLLAFVICAAEPVYRIAHRFDDHFRGTRVVAGNSVKLVWAPEGPGWPDRGVRYADAEQQCRMLSFDGRYLASTPQNFWRLPTVDEVARSMTREGRNAGGYWDRTHKTAQFRVMPDKEAPLWNPETGIIYWWTGSKDANGGVYRMVFDGRVDPLSGKFSMGSLAFRAVREVRSGDDQLSAYAR
ncbi:MAG TPA: hypothetical protein VG225_17740 [Terracidiphilus sp.]|jgi:hypothetical protein|nr:hypothetical protein [Terracidiphilus sp.]